MADPHQTLNTIQQALQAYLASAWKERSRLEVSGLKMISMGWESDVYAFDLAWGPAEARQRQGLILRIYPGVDAWWKSASEFEGMQRLYAADYPVPAVYNLERDAATLGRPFVIMERIDGELLWDPLFHGPQENRPALMALFSGLFVRLHRLDWRPWVAEVELDGYRPETILRKEFDLLRSLLPSIPIPGFDPLLAWVEQRIDGVRVRSLSLVHWDFHPNNVLLRSDGTASVIDWTQLRVSDYRFDLAWTLLLAGCYEGPQVRQQVLDSYAAQAGQKVEDLEFFDAVAALKRVYSMVASIKYGAEKLGMRPGAEQTIRSQSAPAWSAYRVLLERTGLRVPEFENYFPLE